VLYHVVYAKVDAEEEV